MKFKLNFDETNTFCIHLEKGSGGLWEKMEAQLEFFRMNVTRWNVREPFELTDTFSGHLSLLEKCYLQTHINIYKHIIRHNIPYAMILQDNLVFGENWKETLDGFNDKDFSFIYLTAKNKNKNKNNNNGILCPAYIITKRTAEKMMEPDTLCHIHNESKVLSKIHIKLHCFFPHLIFENFMDV